MKRLSLLLFIAFLMCLIIVLPSHALESDLQGHWAEAYMELLADKGIITGYGNGLFRPDAIVTRAEFASMVNKAFGFTKTSNKNFRDVNINAWYAEAISIAVTQGYLQGVGNNLITPEASLTREQAAVIIGKVMQLSANSGKTQFTDNSEISSWAKDMVAAVSAEGYIKGFNGYFRPGDYITRGEVAAILCQALGQVYNLAGVYDGNGQTITGNVTISVAGVTLKNVNIEGNLYITEGVGDGNVTLEGVRVKGNTLVSGGGVNSVIVVNTELGAVTIDVPDGSPIRFAAQGNSSVDSVLVASHEVFLESNNTVKTTIIAIPEGATVDLKGSFGRVEVQTPNCQVEAKDGTITELILATTAKDSKVKLDSTTSVTSLVCDAPCSIEGSGRIQAAYINVNKVAIAQKPATTSIPKGVSAKVAGKTVTGGTSGGSNSSGGGTAATYNLLVESNPKGAATLQGGGVYQAGASVTLTANPIPGWSFSNWTVDGKIVSTQAKFTYVMPKKNVTITANLSKKYKLTVQASPAGAGEVTKSTEYAPGTVFTVTATAKAGYVFDHWKVGSKIESVDESFTSVMPYADTVFTAVFLPENTKDTWDGTIANVIYRLKDESYLVTSGEQLAWIADQVNSGKNSFAEKKIVLSTNIDLNNNEWRPIGTLSHPFKGSFDGKGKTVSGLKVTLNTGSEDTVVAGLFGVIDKAGKVQKLKLENVNISAQLAKIPGKPTYNYAGGLVGINDGEIKNCSVISGQVTAQNGFTNYAGGIAGWNDAGTIKGCFNLANVKVLQTTGAAGGIAGENFGKVETSFNEGSVITEGQEQSYAGGIVGYARNSSTINCFNTGAVTTSGDHIAGAGGIVGNCDPNSKVETSYNTGQIKSEIKDITNPKKVNAAGGVIGILTGSSVNLKNCYFKTLTANQGVGNRSAGGATALSDGQMRNQSSFKGFDFAKTWYFRPLGEYPYPHLQVFDVANTLTIKALPAEGGTAMVEHNAGSKFKAGAIVPLKATPKSGYSFVNWTINGMAVSEEATFNFKMPDSKVTITANFKADDPKVYMLNLSANPSNGGTAFGAGAYYAGEKVTLKANPAKDYTFVGWVAFNEDEPEIISEDLSFTYFMPAEDVELAAVFRNANIPEYQLTLLPSPEKAGKIHLQHKSVYGKYSPGATIRMIAMPEAGYEFVNWTLEGSEVGTEPDLAFLMPEKDITIQANFMPREGEGENHKLTVALNDSSKGRASLDNGASEASYQAGTPVLLTAEATTGNAFVFWTINGRVVGTEPNLTYPMPGKDTIITANFKNDDLYMIAVSSNDDTRGSGFLDYESKETEAYTEGSYLWLKAEPKEGYVFINWTIDGRPVGWLPEMNYVMPAKDIGIVANFTSDDGAMRPLQVALNVEMGGMIYINDEPGTEGSFKTGEIVSLKARDHFAYEFLNWTIGGQVVSQDNEFEFAMPPEGMTIVANFQAIPITAGEEAFLNIAGNKINDFAFAEDKNIYLGVGEKGAVIRSIDEGQTWSQHWSGINGSAVAFGKNIFVAVGDGIALSADGVTWQGASLNSLVDLSDIVYGKPLAGEGKFVAIGKFEGEEHILTSADGVAWKAYKVPESLTCKQIAAGGGYFIIACGNDGLLVSTNGVSWEVRQPFADTQWDHIAYGVLEEGGSFFAFSNTPPRAVFFKTVGAWQLYEWERKAGGPWAFTDLHFDQKFKLISMESYPRIYAVEVADGKVILSESGFGENRKVAGDLVFETKDFGGLKVKNDAGWSTVLGGNPYDFNNMDYGNGVYLLAASKKDSSNDFRMLTAGVVLTSQDGEYWSSYELIPDDYDYELNTTLSGVINDVAYGNGRYFAVGGQPYKTFNEEGDLVNIYKGYVFSSSSAKAETWKIVGQEFSAMLTDIVFSDGKWFVRGYDGEQEVIYTLTDSSTWVEAADGTEFPQKGVTTGTISGCLNDLQQIVLNQDEVWIFGEKGVLVNPLNKSTIKQVETFKLNLEFGEEIVIVEEEGSETALDLFLTEPPTEVPTIDQAEFFDDLNSTPDNQAELEGESFEEAADEDSTLKGEPLSDQEVDYPESEGTEFNQVEKENEIPPDEMTEESQNQVWPEIPVTDGYALDVASKTLTIQFTKELYIDQNDLEFYSKLKSKISVRIGEGEGETLAVRGDDLVLDSASMIIYFTELPYDNFSLTIEEGAIAYLDQEEYKKSSEINLEVYLNKEV